MGKALVLQSKMNITDKKKSTEKLAFITEATVKWISVQVEPRQYPFS